MDKRTVADILGYIIATLLALLMMPQIVKTYKHGHTLGLSIGTVMINALIASIGIAYGILIEEIPLLVGNVVVLSASLSLCCMWLAYRERTKSFMHDRSRSDPPMGHVVITCV